MYDINGLVSTVSWTQPTAVLGMLLKEVKEWSEHQSYCGELELREGMSS